MRLSREELKTIIIESLNLEGLTPGEISDDDPLFGEGLGLDSVDALELVVALEKRLGVRIESHEIDRAAFESVSSMHRFIEERAARHQDAS